MWSMYKTLPMSSGLFSRITSRTFSLYNVKLSKNVDKALLSKLRKTTGYPLMQCKSALLSCENDYEKSLALLQEKAHSEGWTKANKLMGRSTMHGLIGLIAEGRKGAMIEVNCETDFVARNEKFQVLVSQITRAFFQFCCNSSPIKVDMDGESLGALHTSEGDIVRNLLALNIGSIGENMSARRAVFLRAPDNSYLGHYLHCLGQKVKPIGNVMLGKYGSLVTYHMDEKVFNAAQTVEKLPTVVQIGQGLAQHVVGMNPMVVGESPKSGANSSNINHAADLNGVPEESAMLEQEYLLDPSLTVREYCNDLGITVDSIIRYDCGEEIKESSS